MTAAVTSPPPPVVAVRLGGGVATARAWLAEPAGVIRVYRITAPRGVRARASVELPHVTVPIGIATRPVQPANACRGTGGRVVCTASEEACPMPAGTWRVVIRRRAGPAGEITVRFVVGASA